MKKQRESGIELLRILAAISVVFLHFNFPGAFGALWDDSSTLPLGKTMVLIFFESVSICAVNVFILITGYFLSTNDQRSIGKPFMLLLQLVVIKLLIWFFGIWAGEHTFSLPGLFMASLPRSYFVSLYIALYLISPYLNIVLQSLSKREWKVYLILCLSLFSIWETVLNVGDDLVNTNLNTMSAISHWGGGCGHTLLNFALLYSLGAFLRLNDFRMRTSKSVLYLSSITLLIFLCFFFEIHHKKEIINFTISYYYNPLVILQSVFAFLLFQNLSFKSPFINEIAKAAFTCYIINGFVISMIGGGEMAVHLSAYQLFFFLIFGGLGTYILAYILYKLFIISTNWLVKILDSCSVNYWDNDSSKY